MATVIDIRTRQAYETARYVPSFGAFVSAKVPGKWYTAKRPSPKMMAGRHFISAKEFDAMKSEYKATFGREAHR